jgi:hypothetical protein
MGYNSAEDTSLYPEIKIIVSRVALEYMIRFGENIIIKKL